MATQLLLHLVYHMWHCHCLCCRRADAPSNKYSKHRCLSPMSVLQRTGPAMALALHLLDGCRRTNAILVFSIVPKRSLVQQENSEPHSSRSRTLSSGLSRVPEVETRTCLNKSSIWSSGPSEAFITFALTTFPCLAKPKVHHHAR